MAAGAVSGGLEFSPMTAPLAGRVVLWSYDPPLDVYTAPPGERSGAVARMLDPQNHYFGVFSGGELIAFCCFGPDARVPGGGYDADALDVGLGLRPDLVGVGLGRLLLDAVTAFADRSFGARPLRATVAAFNQAALRVCLAAGLERVSVFRSDSGAEFVQLRRRATG